MLLTNLCQDSSLDIVLRLKLLEVTFQRLSNLPSYICNLFIFLLHIYFLLQVIELRSLGWKKDPTVENYYKERWLLIFTLTKRALMTNFSS